MRRKRIIVKVSSTKSMFVMIGSVVAYAVDIRIWPGFLDKINLCDDCRCGCIRHKCIIRAGRPR